MKSIEKPPQINLKAVERPGPATILPALSDDARVLLEGIEHESLPHVHRRVIGLDPGR